MKDLYPLILALVKNKYLILYNLKELTDEFTSQNRRINLGIFFVRTNLINLNS